MKVKSGTGFQLPRHGRGRNSLGMEVISTKISRYGKAVFDIVLVFHIDALFAGRCPGTV